MKNHYFILWICLSILMAFQLILPKTISAQVKFTTKLSAIRVAQNNEFTVTFTLSGGKGSSFTPPTFTGLNIIGSMNAISQGSGVTMVNGKAVINGSGTEQWIFTLTGSKLGSFTIGPAKIKVKNKWVNSNIVTVEIVKGTTKTKQSQKPQHANTEKKSGEDIFVKATIDKTKVTLGEQLTLTYTIYTSMSLENMNYVNNSGFNGFWAHELSRVEENSKRHMETINGVEYLVAEIRKIALFPQKTGTLKIDPLEIECFTKIESYNGFFSSFYLDRKAIKSNALTINVSPLPERDKPEPFSGAVGNFTFTAEVDRTEVKQNEAFTLKLNVKGTGNISLIDLPSPEFPSDFEVYDPETTEDITQNSNPIAGSRTYEYLIIPRNPGDFSIKPFTFNYYDPKAKTYKSISAPAINIKVAKGNGNGNKPVSQEDVELIGSDIRYMLPRSLPLTVQGRSFYNSLWFYLILLAPVLIFAAFVTIWRRRIKINSNERLRKNMRATRVARQRLNTAAKHLQQKQSDAFYIEVSKALWGYVCDKFSIQLSDLSLDMVAEILQQQDIRPDVRESLIQILNQCEFARYAPAGSAPDMEELYNKSTLIILEIEQNLNTQKAKKTS